MSKHTPGPWCETEVRQISGYFDGGGLEGARYWHAARIVNSLGEPLAHVSRYKDDSGDYLESIANARLIAAAPELLSACIRMMVGITKRDTHDCEWYEGIEHDGAEEARAAIAKAEGGSEED